MRCLAIALILVAAVGQAFAAGIDDLREAGEATANRKHEDAIRLYTSAIDVQDLSPKDQIEAYLGRAREYSTTSQNDRAVADYDEAIRLGAGFDAYEGRGWAQRDAGRLDKAVADFDAAIRVAPEEPGPYASRAGVYRAMGQFDDAIADFGEAIRLRPDSDAMLIDRGKVFFLKGEYLLAVDNFAAAVATAKGLPQQVIWLHLARLRAHHSDSPEFALNASRVDLDDWPGQIIGLYLGRRTMEVVLEAAKRGKEDAQRMQACEAALHLGLYELGRNAPDQAKSRFAAAREACSAADPEADIAKAELARLTK